TSARRWQTRLAGRSSALPGSRTRYTASSTPIPRSHPYTFPADIAPLARGGVRAPAAIARLVDALDLPLDCWQRRPRAHPALPRRASQDVRERTTPVPVRQLYPPRDQAAHL